jgi:hypothetical protein
MIRQRRVPVRVSRDLPSPKAHYQDPWIPYPEGADVVKALGRLIARPDEGRPFNLALIGDSGFGKSHLLDYFADCFPDVMGEERPRIQVILLSVTAECDGRALMRGLLTELGARYKVNDAYDELLRDLCIKAEVAEVGIIVLDEFHNGINSRRDRTLNFIKAVRDISNYLRRPIAVAGDDRVKELLRYDKQLHERFQVKTLPTWGDKERVKRYLATFDPKLGLPEFSDLGTDKVAEKVMALAGDHMGSISELIREGGSLAKKDGSKKLTVEHILKAHDLVKRGLG